MLETILLSLTLSHSLTHMIVMIFVSRYVLSNFMHAGAAAFCVNYREMLENYKIAFLKGSVLFYFQSFASALDCEYTKYCAVGLGQMLLGHTCVFCYAAAATAHAISGIFQWRQATT